MNTIDTPIRNTLIKASAGSGKTFQLSNRYLQLIFGGVAPDTILATTFTRKAAGEILQRILRRLAEAARDEKERKELAKHIVDDSQKADTAQKADISREKVLATLAALARNIHRLRISTLDSFFQQIAGSFHLELEMPPGWTILEPKDEATLITETVRLLLERNEKDRIVELMHLLFKGETRSSIAGEIENLAGSLTSVFKESLSVPGAWKTVSRAGELSAEELQFLIRRLSLAEIMTNKDGSPDKNTLKARDKDLAGLRVEDTTQIDWVSIGSAGMCQKILDGTCTYSRKPMTPSLIEVYETLVRQVRAVVVNRLVSRTEAMGDLIKDVSAILDEQKQTRRLFGFDDITNRLAARDLEEWTDRISHRTDSYTDHLLLDEFQDTSPNQWKVLRPFATRIVSMKNQETPLKNQEKSSKIPPSFFCVGDVKQAIYGWRGGIAAIFDTIENDLGEGKLHEERLDTSWRSSQPVIDTVNELFRDIVSNDALIDYPSAAEKWQKRFEEHSTKKTAYPGFCSLETSWLPRERLDENGNVITPTSLEKEQAHLDYVVEKVEKIVEKVGKLHQRDPGAKIKIGILTRTNDMIRKIIDRLRERGIKASEEGGNPLDRSAAVEIILSALTLADHPGNEIAGFHLAHSPLGPPLGMTPANYREDRKNRENRVAQTVASHIRKRLLYEGYFPVLREWAEILAPHCDVRDLRKLVQLLELASLYQSKAGIRTRPFVDLVRTRKVEDPTAANIRVMSIHRSKGLEFDIVVLPELDESLTGKPPMAITRRENATGPIDTVFTYPSSDVLPYLPARIQDIADQSKNEKVEETLCLLYVAMTRAVHELVMIIAPDQKPEPTFPKTMAGVLRFALAEEKPATEMTTLFVCGNSQWLDSLAASPKTVTAPHDVEILCDTEKNVMEQDMGQGLALSLAPSSKRPRRNFHRVSPSDPEGEDRETETMFHPGIDTIFTSDNHRAINRGKAIHACFEKITWLDKNPLNADEAFRIMTPFIADETQRREVADEFLKICRLPEILDALSFDRYRNTADFVKFVNSADSVDAVKVYNERKFMIRLSDDTLQPGSIDRLVVFSQNGKPIQAEIFDFKTDRLPNDPDRLAEQTARYRPQLEAYRKAVARLYTLDLLQISAKLLFTSVGRVVPVAF